MDTLYFPFIVPDSYIFKVYILHFNTFTLIIVNCDNVSVLKQFSWTKNLLSILVNLYFQRRKYIQKSMSENSDSEADEGFLDGDIVDNIFNQKDSNAHLEMDFESATKYVRYVF